MERQIRVFHSFAESEQADRDYYHSLSPAQRMEILLDLINQWQTMKLQKDLREFIGLLNSTKIKYLSF
jgi:hypothetical protein